MPAGRRDGRSFGNWCLEEHDLINMRKSLTINSVDACRKTIIKGLVKLLPKGQWSRSAAHHKFSQEFKTHFADFDSLQSFMYADKFCLLTLIVLPWTAKKTGLVDHQWSWSSEKPSPTKGCSRYLFINRMANQDNFYLSDDWHKDFHSSDDWPRCSHTGRAQWRWRQAPG